MQNFPGAPNGAQKGLKPLILGQNSPRSGEFFLGPSVGVEFPPLLLHFLEQGGGNSTPAEGPKKNSPLRGEFYFLISKIVIEIVLIGG